MQNGKPRDRRSLSYSFSSSCRTVPDPCAGFLGLFRQQQPALPILPVFINIGRQRGGIRVHIVFFSGRSRTKPRWREEDEVKWAKFWRICPRFSSVAMSPSCRTNAWLSLKTAISFTGILFSAFRNSPLRRGRRALGRPPAQQQKRYPQTQRCAYRLHGFRSFSVWWFGGMRSPVHSRGLLLDSVTMRQRGGRMVSAR